MEYREEAERDRRGGGGQETRKEKDRCIKNEKQMDKLRLKESERSVTERVEETDIMREEEEKHRVK